MLTPSKETVYLGFRLETKDMTIQITEETSEDKDQWNEIIDEFQ